jgi:hypothetical protein
MDVDKFEVSFFKFPTFSSWAGFLKTEGDVIAPFQRRHDLDEPRNIYPDHWTTIDPFVASE